MEFKDSAFMTAQEKKKVLNHLKKFVQGGFREDDFTDALYEHLHLRCGFIAHYNKKGFYKERFLDLKGKEKTITILSEAHQNGGPDYKDINKAISSLFSGAVTKELLLKNEQEIVDQKLKEASRLLDEVIGLKKGLGYGHDFKDLQKAKLILAKELIVKGE